VQFCSVLRTPAFHDPGVLWPPCQHFGSRNGESVAGLLRRLWKEYQGQDIAEYAVMLAVILVLVVGTIRLVGSSANSAFSSVASSLQ